MSYRNQPLPEPLQAPQSKEQVRWGAVHGIVVNCTHMGDNQGLCLDGRTIMTLIDLMGLHDRCRRLFVFDLPHKRSVFKNSYSQTFGDTCTVIPNDICKVKA
jgi:hypothetical protein